MCYGRWAGLALLCCTVASLFSAAPVVAGDYESAEVSGMPLLERVIAQSFQVGVISGRYGVFNATLILKNSPNFPEHIHGELIPTGEQRKATAGQVPLEHFKYPRSMQTGMLPHGALDAHPSLLSIDVQLEFSGSTIGTVSAWSLPAEEQLLEQRLSEVEEIGATPTATASFSFVPEAASMSPSTLSDVPAMARTATGIVTLEGERSGTFTFRFFSEHEFSLVLQLHTEETTVDRIWVYGYVAPDNALLLRPDTKQRSWFQKHSFLVFAVTFFVIRAITSYIDVKRARKHQVKAATEATEAAESKKVK
ncbi:hypothetical protein TraAM80_00124 [Trypanosoma rangeli]|uniref:Transmembrane protein n=1 Tax=Trypanosoma rangeli TaxID=5698 RepID=A0A422P4W9_TRYRA|nr:uncharacterized protein TraAM80_00124 [Trypanosoma rangeli]RNF12769.1 hypothetical protein TraAM80_00124 [Trypanosoma rangeli]|eukprot:RNF12769.1 hypothetical protein TraAM80_00124 [Trypanosoma rangeli]